MSTADATTQPIDAPGPHHQHTIGPYTILGQLGEGGFGIVYHAERREPFVQRVALKVIRPGMDTREVLARFDQERQALAVMDHPNVARVLDGGVTPPEQGSRPYFVMEFVKGEPITTYCDRNRLNLRERLELMIPVCEAVQHAHHKGLIHRDIKPSNVLVTILEGRATPKVIDFGVAKALSHTLTQRTLYTEQGKLIGTPEYMSPEQAEMGATDVDTRTDVYSLGVLLYELLTGSLPFEQETLRKAAFDEVRRIIREQDPPKPSTRLTTQDDATVSKCAQQRQIDRQDWTRTLRRELEWIPLKAIRKDRARRYATPAALAEDITNYLEGKPIDAAPESTAYLFRKLVARHKGPIAAGAAVLLALLLGAAGIAYMANQWRSQRNEAQAATLREAEARRIAEERANIIDAQRERQDRLSKILELFGSAHAEFSANAMTDDGPEYTAWKSLVDQLNAGQLKDLPQAEVAIRVSLAQVILDELQTDEPQQDPNDAIALLRPALAIADKEMGPNAEATLNVIRRLRTALMESAYYMDDETDFDEEGHDAARVEMLQLMNRECEAMLQSGAPLPTVFRLVNSVLSDMEDYNLQYIRDIRSIEILEKWFTRAREAWHPNDDDLGRNDYFAFAKSIASLSTSIKPSFQASDDPDLHASLLACSDRWMSIALAMGWQPPPPTAPTTPTPAATPAK